MLDFSDTVFANTSVSMFHTPACGTRSLVTTVTMFPAAVEQDMLHHE